MTSSVDSRIVTMKFDNAAFEKDAGTTLSTLDKLKTGLNFDGATKGIENISAAAGHFNLDSITNATSNISAGFIAMSTVAITALSTIVSKAVDAGLSLVNAFSFGPITDGFSNYETQINATKTILANTAAEGTKLKDVNQVLGELQTYANQTVYNFADMTKNIGTFTAAGVGLKDSTASIKGIANLAAFSGSTSQQASSAMYQLSQAIASGTVKLQDWNSVTNAGIGGKTFQTALINDAKAQGVAVDALIKKNGSFRQSLQEGWLTSKILTQTLSQFTGDLSLKQIEALGYTEKEAKAVLKTGKTALDSAVQIKTLTQLMQALKEEVAAAWGHIFFTIFGNINEATKSFSALHTVMENALTGPINSLNVLLESWAKLGGRTKLIEAITNAWHALGTVLGPIKRAFGDIFPAATAQGLYNLTVKIDDFFKKIALGRRNMHNLRDTFAGLFAVIDIGRQIIGGIVKALFGIIGVTIGSSGSILHMTGSIGLLLKSLDLWLQKTDIIGKAFTAVFAHYGGLLKPILHVISIIINSFAKLIDQGPSAFFKDISRVPKALGDVGFAIVKFIFDPFKLVIKALKFLLDHMGNFGKSIEHAGTAVKDLADKGLKALSKLTPAFGFLSKGIDGISLTGLQKSFDKFMNKVRPNFEKFGGEIQNAFGKVENAVTPVFKSIGDGISSAFSHVPAVLTSVGHAFQSFFGLFSGLGSAIGGIFGSIGGSGSTGGVQSSVASLSDGLKPTLTLADKVGSVLKKIGGYIHPVVKAAGDAIVGIGSMAAKIVTVVAEGIGAITIGIAKGIGWSISELTKIPGGIFAGFKAIFGGLKNLIKGLFSGITVQDSLTAVNSVFFASMVLTARKFITTFDVFVKAFTKSADGFAGVLEQTEKNLKSMQKSIKYDIILKIAEAIFLLAAALFILSKIKKAQLAAGLIAMAAMLKGLMLAMADIEKEIGPTGARKFILVGAGLVAMATAILILSAAVAVLGHLKLTTLTKGMVAIGVVIGGITAMTKSLAESGGGATMLAAAASLVILSIGLTLFAGALVLYSKISPETMLKGGLLIVASMLVISETMKRMPIKGMLKNAIALGIIAVALTILAGALKIMGGMSMPEIGKAMLVLFGSLTLLVIALNLMTEALPGAAALLVASVALIALGVAMKILGDLSLKEIGIAMLAMVAAFIVLGAAGLILAPVIPAIMGLGAAVLLLGAGMALAGLGILLFSTGLAALAVTGAAGIAVLVAGIIAFGGTLPILAEQFGLAFVEFIKVIGDSGKEIVDAFFKILNALLDAVIKVIPKLGHLMERLIKTGLHILVSNAKSFGEAGLTLLENFLASIRDHLPKLAKTARQIIVAFIRALADNAIKIANAALDTLIVFINGLSDAIDTHASELGEAGGKLARAILKGIGDAFAGGVDGLTGGLAGDLVHGVTGAVGKVGGLFGIGNRVIAGQDSTYQPGDNSGTDNPTVTPPPVIPPSPVTVIQQGAIDASTIPSDGINVAPKITPVLDLTKMQADATKITGIFTPGSTLGSNAFDRAAKLAAEQEAMRNAQQAQVNDKGGDTNITFEQHNTSPKSIGAVEVYRNTRSQLAFAKEALKKQ